MDLGEKLRKARLEAGMSQRELCAGEVTRNMLSQIENGSARPSMKTLAFFARQLGKPVSYFLEDTAVVSPNIPVMTEARRQYDAGNWVGAVAALADFSQPDEVFGRERDLIWAWSHLFLAQQALERGQNPYALRLLEQADIPVAYGGGQLRRSRLLLAGKLGQRVSTELPSLDEELLIRGREALAAGQLRRCEQILDAAQDQENPRWNLLRGDACLAEQAYTQAAVCYHRAESEFPKETAPKLEQCYKELGDFKQAYFYACKTR